MALSKIVREDVESIVSRDLDWNAFDNATVLITGASGFLPAYLVETLLHLNDVGGRNIKVIGLVRNQEKTLKRFAHHQGRPDLRLLAQDVCEPLTALRDTKIDFIIHAASQATPKVYGIDPVGTMLPNIVGTNNLLQLAYQKKSKGFLFFSSGEVYGQTDDAHIPTKESYSGSVDISDVRSCYGESKRAGEALSVSWHHQYGVPAKNARLFHTYGPGMDLNDGRVFADFVSDIVKGRDIVMKSEGKHTRAFCYIADAIAGIFTVLLKGAPGEAYNVGVDVETSIMDLAHIMTGLFPEKELKVAIDVPAADKGRLENKISRTCPDITKIRSLGWEPQVDIRSGFKRTVLSYENH